MRRFLTRFAGACAVILLTLIATPAHAGVDDFSYDSWDSRYALSLGGDGRAVMRVTETLVPQFPDFDQNRGIVRALPLRYEGAPSAPEDITVTDAAGNAVPFEIEDDDTFRMILVGDDSYVHGRQTYEISYTIHDPILSAADTESDELYWDVLPLERKQPIEAFSFAVDLSPEFAAALTGNVACYTGPANSTERCNITASETGVSVPAMQVAPGSGVTVAIGFAPGTVTQPQERQPSFALDALPTLLAGAAAASSVAGWVTISRLRTQRRTARGVVVAQYDVPDHLPPLIAGPIAGAKGSALTAQLVHLAVNGVTRFEDGETSEGLLGTGKPRPVIRLLNTGLARDQLDQKTVRALFRKQSVDSVIEIPKKSEKFAKRMQKLTAEGVTAAQQRGYFTKEASLAARVLGCVTLGFAAVAATLWGLSLSREPGPGMFLTVAFGLPAAIAAIGLLLKHKVHTRLGAETREYLEGVREFIRVAEADRLQMLQSYSGAERLVDGSINVVHIYEKLLPYAMLFGLEKEWSRVLEVRYKQEHITSPMWYPAMMLTKAPLSRSLAYLSSTFTSAASYSSSSSGGSSGGGFSGGGGGGGFSGGR